MSSPASFHGFSADDTSDPPTPPSYSFNSKIMVVAIIVLLLMVFLILMIHVYAKWFLRRSSPRSYTIRRGIAFVSPQAATSAHSYGGLDKAVIALMPTFVYKSSSAVDFDAEAGTAAGDGPAAAKPSLECAVCLSEFQDDEKCRLLPACKHIFHTDCIDMWFSSHSTCPLCRTTVGQAMEPSPAAETAASDEQRQEGEGQEAMGASPAAAMSGEGNWVVSNRVEYPANVLFWGNQTQASSSQEPPSSRSGSLRMAGARALPQIRIDIPPVEGNTLGSASGPLSAKLAAMEQQEAAAAAAGGSSQPLKSPSLRISIKRMLSRQSSRHRSFSHEANEDSPQ